MEQPKRRLSAVWFADIVGYTTISSHDEPAALQLVEILQRGARAAVAAHEGRIVKFIGDAVLAEFSSAESAVRAAVSLQEAYEEGASAVGRDSKLRVGVHLGEVNATPDGDLYGDGINTAARLQGEAKPGQVLASEDVWRQLRQRPEFRFAPLGAVELKGITTRVEVYDVLFGGRAALAARVSPSDARPSQRTRTGMHPALRIALIGIPLVVGATLLAQNMMSGGAQVAEPDSAAGTTAAAAPIPAPIPAAPVVDTVVIVQTAPPAPETKAPPSAAEATAAARGSTERPNLRPRPDRVTRAETAAGEIRAFLETFVGALSTEAPRAALGRTFPDANPAQLRNLQQLRQSLGDSVRLRLGPVMPRGARGDTADVRFSIIATGPRGNDLPIFFEGLIARGVAGLHFTELRRPPAR